MLAISYGKYDTFYSTENKGRLLRVSEFRDSVKFERNERFRYVEVNID